MTVVGLVMVGWGVTLWMAIDMGSRMVMQALAAVEDRLEREFPRLPAEEVHAVIRACCEDLDVVPSLEAVPELVERLARQRLCGREHDWLSRRTISVTRRRAAGAVFADRSEKYSGRRQESSIEKEAH